MFYSLQLNLSVLVSLYFWDVTFTSVLLVAQLFSLWPLLPSLAAAFSIYLLGTLSPVDYVSPTPLNATRRLEGTGMEEMLLPQMIQVLAMFVCLFVSQRVGFCYENVMDIFLQGLFFPSLVRARRESFLGLHCENQVGFLQINSMKVWPPLFKTRALTRFSVSCQSTLSFQQFIRINV